MTDRARQRRERLMRLLFRGYPAEFRDLIGDDMAVVFAVECARVESLRGSRAARWYAARTLGGAAVAAAAARLRQLFGAGRDRRFGNRRPTPPPRGDGSEITGGRARRLDGLVQDIRYAVRTMRRSPGFAAAAVCSLGLGIGANTAVFSVVNAILLQPIPYPGGDRLVVLWQSRDSLGSQRIGPSGPIFLEWRDRSESFEEMTAFEPGSSTILGPDEPQQVPAMRVSTNFLSMLGAEPMLGRDFEPEEGRGGRHNVVIFTHGFWQQTTGGDPSILGRTVIGDGLPYTVIGVLPPDFWLPVASEAFVPWDEDELRERSPSETDLGVLARLRPGVGLAEARAEMDSIAADLERDFDYLRGWGVSVVPYRDVGTELIGRPLLVLFGAVGFVLLIACANVANLLLARGAARRREIAIRAATGASRGRLARQLLTESALLGLAGGLAGLLLGFAGLRWMSELLPSRVAIPRASAEILLPEAAVDGSVLTFTMAVAIATGLAFGLFPALQLSRESVGNVLRRADPRGGGGRTLRGTLVAAEVGLAVVLLAGTALMLQTLWNLQQTELGFDPSSVLTMQLEIPTDTKYPEDHEQAVFYGRIMERLRALPGIEAAGISEILPLDVDLRRLEFEIEGFAAPPELPLVADYNIADDGFFRALRIPLLRGRLFSERDDLERPPVVVVDEVFAQRYFAGENPLGKGVLLGSRHEVIGVVGSVRSAGLDEPPRPTLYFSYLQEPDNLMSFVLRARGAPAEVVPLAKAAIWAVDAEQPVFDIRRMEDVVAQSTSTRRLTLVGLAAFGGIAVLMAAVGVYGVMAYSVRQRTREIGVRQALGAGPADLLGMVVSQGMMLAAVGVGLGTGTALLLTRTLASLLYEVSATEPLPLLAVGGVLLIVALLASYVPARRATRVDPMAALRQD